MFRLIIGLLWLSFGLNTLGFANAEPVAHPPIEAYGERPSIRSVSMSPSGRQIALISRVDDRDLLILYDPENGVRPAVDLTTLQGNWVWFPTEEHVVIRGYETTRIAGYRGELDYSAAFSYSLETKKINQLLTRTDQLYPAQSGLGRIIGMLEGTNQVLMPAWTGRKEADLGRALFKVDLNRRKGRVFDKGSRHTLDWLVAPDGTVLAREDMDNKNDVYAIYTKVDGKERKLLERRETARPPFSVLGVKSDQSALILWDLDDESDQDFVELDFEGNLRPIQLGRRGGTIESMFTDNNKIVHGLRYAGPVPSYEFFDPAVNAVVQQTIQRFDGFPIEIIDRSSDFSVILLKVFDFRSAGRYVVLDVATGELTGLANAREQISAEALGAVEVIEYSARDGLTIPAILTWPAGLADDERKNLPTIVMPHGGPRAYDSVGFDWLSQYFANRGYLVLQPNFRGSTGYGADFMLAGNGEWGGKMQDDISDGLNALITAGYADPDRTCIIGWSYGGYAALAGGAFTPELYKCVIAVAPVSDLLRLLVEEKRDHGKEHFILDYWQEIIGDPKTDKARLEATSPVNFAENFQAPVLLIHGEDDRSVNYQQSVRMRSALRKAGKSVELLKIKGDGYSLLDNDNRLEALQAMSDFVERTIGDQTIQD